MRRLAALSLLLLLTPAPSKAEFVFNPNLVTIGLGPAFLDNDAGTTFYLGGRVDLATFAPGWGWDAGFHWWSKSEDETVLGNTVETSIRDFALKSGVKYSFTTSNPEWVPYARGGLAMNFFSVEAESNGFSADASDTELGIYVGGGIDYHYSDSMYFGAEAAAHFSDADFFLLGATVSFPFGSGN